MANYLKGIDVSTWQGNIDWKKVKASGIDFAMLRAGYGKGNIDNKFNVNAKGCNDNSIPFGVYWFSYAYTEAMAKAEADYCINAIKKYKVEYPVCFDFEYDSMDYANKNGVTINASKLASIGKAFLSRVEELGYYAMNYTNIDYLNKGFSSLTTQFDTWIAQWSSSAPSRKWGIWQYSAKGAVSGINGSVDMNYSANDYAKIIKENCLNNLNDSSNNIPENSGNNHGVIQNKTIEGVHSVFKNLYNILADEIIAGKWGVGYDRKKSVIEAGYDYDYVQSIVNAKLE